MYGRLKKRCESRRDACPQAFCGGRNFLFICERSLRKTDVFISTFLLSNNNNTTTFQLHLQFFAHAIMAHRDSADS